ncbi:unnamed protein product [Tenebrio molitor]|nr:unnamed protein product [Tenebrio molitor]
MSDPEEFSHAVTSVLLYKPSVSEGGIRVVARRVMKPSVMNWSWRPWT